MIININQIPKSRLDSNGVALLNVFALPNFSNRAISGGNYNYVFSARREAPLTTSTGKIDYIVNSRNTLAGTLNLYTNEQTGSMNLPDSGGITSVAVNGSVVKPMISKGYCVITRAWKAATGSTSSPRKNATNPAKRLFFRSACHSGVPWL
jgi:hypothetical protein